MSTRRVDDLSEKKSQKQGNLHNGDETVELAVHEKRRELAKAVMKGAENPWYFTHA